MFEITLINVDYGQVLNENGFPKNKGEQEFSPQFDSLDKALAKKDLLLKKIVYAGVILKNIETNEFSEYYNEELGPKYIEEKRAYYAWASLPYHKRIFKKKPRFKYYDGQR